MTDERYVRRLGTIRVTALNDGQDELPFAVMRNIGDDVLTEESPDGMLHPVINSYLVETGGKRLLIDAGAGVHMGPRLGKMPANLARAGVAPDEIDAIFLTHCHRDHILGIADQNWDPIFPNAELLVPEHDNNFFLQRNASKIDNEYQREDAIMAQKAAAAYRGRIRAISADEVAPGVTLVPLPGHTPGHSGYLIQAGGNKLFLWGDIVHFPTFQPTWPNANLIFDVDPLQARETRKETFERMIADGMEIGGGHLLAPGFASVQRDTVAYRIVPSDG